MSDTGTRRASTRPSGIDALAAFMWDRHEAFAWAARRAAKGGSIEGVVPAFITLGRLQEVTEWEADTLLTELGCTRRTMEQLDALRDEEIEASLKFLRWVHALAKSTPDEYKLRRAAVSQASELYVVGYEFEACKAALQRPIDAAGWTGCDLIVLGEVDAAFRFARRFLPGPAGERARELAEQNPYAALPVLHIAPERLDEFAKLGQTRHSEVIGPERAERIGEHLTRCGVCEREYDRSTERIGAKGYPNVPLRFRAVGG